MFVPRREHARFCSARCRVAWNRGNTSDPAAGMSALGWSFAEMRDATERLPLVSAWDRSRAVGVIGEAVWSVTIVDATLVRYYPEAYDDVLARRVPAERCLIEETLAGLRFVRNQMGYEVDQLGFVQPEPRSDRSGGRITAWTWKSMPEPALASLSPRGRAWEMTRYQAYESQLAGSTVGEIFQRAAAFLELAAASASSVSDLRAHAAP